MVGIFELWLPILVSGIGVFIVSSIIHTAIGFHKNDWTGMPGEDSVRAALRDAKVPPGHYYVPHVPPADYGKPGIKEKFEAGPVGLVTVLPSGLPSMGSSLIAWFIYCLVAGVLVAYVTGTALPAGADYLKVFQIAGAVAFITYAGAEPTASIWFKRSWGITIKFIVDGLAYALVTAGVFGWLWPR